MNISDYKFNVGDEVITTEGERGKITYICECNKCKERAFCEPIWVKDGESEEEYITNYTAQTGFKGFYRIGQYRFDDFCEDNLLRRIEDHEEEILRCRKQLANIKEIREREVADGRV